MDNSLGLFYSDLDSFPVPARTKGEFFSDLHPENLVGLLEVKLTEVCLPCVPYSHTHQHSGFSSSSKLLFECFHQCTALVAAVPGKQVSAGTLHSPVSLDYQGSPLPCDLCSLIEKPWFFSFFLLE